MTTALAKKASQPTPKPAWFLSLLHSFEAAEGCAFLLYSGISDYVRTGVTVPAYLKEKLVGPFELIVSYTVSQGITFAQPHMRKRFFTVMAQEDEQPDAPILMAPEPAVALLLSFLKKAPAQTACVILERLDNMVGELVPVDPSVISLMEMLHDAGTDPALEAHGNPLIMLSPSLEEIRPQVRAISSGIKAIEIPLPDYDARLAFARQRLASEEEVELDGITVEQLAGLTAGLYRRHVENVILRARSNGGRLTRELATAVQRELMDSEYAGIVRRVDTTFVLDDVGGLVEFKDHAVTRVIEPLRNGKPKRVPNAVLLVGPPGGGKTMGAMAVANQSGLNCLIVDLSQLMGGIVGQTEGNVAKFKRAVYANAPCVVIADEIDQKIRRGEGGADSGGGGAVENRLFASMLEMIEEFKGRGVVWYFMSNRPDLLDAAFLSRMQAIIPILPPETDGARADVLERIIRRLSSDLDEIDQMDPSPAWMISLAAKLKDWSGRDIEQVVNEALAIADLEDRTLADALEETIKYRRADTTDVRRQVREALKACKDLRLLPEKYRAEATQVPVTGTDPVTEYRRQRRTLEIE
jgi:transitional endoplasmic reticulum ATPase